MNSQVKIVTGQVRKVYNPVGAIVKSIDEFEEGAPYICAGAEKLNKELGKLLLKYILKGIIIINNFHQFQQNLENVDKYGDKKMNNK